MLPENLKEFSMYMLSMIKSRAFKGEVYYGCNNGFTANRASRWSGIVRPADS